MGGDIVISKETAEEQVELMLDYYDIDLVEDFDESEDSQEGRGAALRSYQQLVKDTMKGRLSFVLNDENDLIITQKLRFPIKSANGLEQIVYKPVTGRSKTAMKAASTNDHAGKLYAFLGGVSGQGSQVIQELKATDLKTAECLGLIFLAV